MGNKFDSIAVGDQLELPAKRGGGFYSLPDNRDPMRPVQAVIVTHRWTDPYEQKEYVCLCRILMGGKISQPYAKHTIKGLAQAGWIPARRDWLAYAAALEAGEVVSISSRVKGGGG